MLKIKNLRFLNNLYLIKKTFLIFNELNIYNLFFKITTYQHLWKNYGFLVILFNIFDILTFIKISNTDFS